MQFYKWAFDKLSDTRDFFLDKSKTAVSNAKYAGYAGLAGAALLLACGGSGDSQSTSSGTASGQYPKRPEIQVTRMNSQELSRQYPQIFQVVNNTQINYAPSLVNGVRAKIDAAGDCLNLRDGPGTKSRLIKCVADRTVVTISENRKSEERDGYKWWPVDVPGIGSGYMAENWLKYDFSTLTTARGAVNTSVYGATVPTPDGKRILIAKNVLQCGTLNIMPSRAGRAWVFDENNRMILDTGQRGALNFEFDYLNEDDMPDLKLASHDRIACNSDAIFPSELLIYDIKSSREIFKSPKALGGWISIENVDTDMNKEIYIREAAPDRNSIKISFFDIGPDGGYVQSAVPRNVILDTLVYDLTSSGGGIGVYYPWANQQQATQAYRNSFGNDVVNEAQAKVNKIQAARTEMKSAASNSSYSATEKQQRFRKIFESDPEVAVRASILEGGYKMEQLYRNELGLQITYQSSGVVRQLLANSVASGASGNFAGALSNLAAAYFVTEATKSTISGLNTPTSGTTSRPEYKPPERRYQVGGKEADSDLLTDSEKRSNVVTEKRQDEIRRQQEARDKEKAGPDWKAIEKETQQNLQKDPLYNACKNAGLCR